MRRGAGKQALVRARRWLIPGAVLLLGAGPAPARCAEGELVVMVEERSLSAWSHLQELARGFEKRHRVRVKLVDLGGAAGSKDKVKFMLAGGMPLDLVRVDVTEIAAFEAEGALLDIEDFTLADPNWDEQAFFPGPLTALRSAEGRLLGLPSTFTPYVMYVNLDLLRELDAPRPTADWDWEDFLALARAGTLDRDGDGRSDQFGISLTQWLQAVVPWIWQSGGELLSEDRSSSRLSEPACVEAFEFLRRLLHVERVASFDATLSAQLSQGLFQAGRALLYGPVGYWETYRFRNVEAFEWDVLPLPRGPRGKEGGRAATAVAMTAYVVPRTARDPELAYQFMREVTGPSYQRLLAEIGNGVPGRIAAAESASFLAPDRPPASEGVFLDVMEQARFLPPLANWRKIESLLQAELEGLLLSGELGAEEAAERMAKKTDAYLAREARRAARPAVWRGAMQLSLSLSMLAALALFLTRRRRQPAPALAGEERAGLWMILPWAVGFLAFALGPAVASALLSVCEWSPLRPIDDLRWLGTENYRRLAGDPTFRTSLGVTLLYTALVVPVGMAAALGLALLLRTPSRLVGLVRTVVYLPAVISPVIVAIVFRYLYDAEDGPIEGGLAALGIDGPAWLRDPDWVLPAFVGTSLWSVGAQMLVFLAALQSLDPDLEDAARIDGAGAWRRFWHVVLPSLSPVLLFNAVTGTIASFQVFAQPYLMTQGGPGDASRFLVLYLYESGFRHLDMGYASALAWVMFVVLVLLCALLLRLARARVHYAGRRAG